MSQATIPLPALSTVADLLEHLGNIPPDRVRFKPTPGTATEQDVVEIHDREKRLCELVDGVLVEKAMGFYESRLAVVLIQFLENFSNRHDLGIVVGADGMMRLGPGLVRIPDVSFIAWKRFPDRKLPREPIPDLAPDLAVEVLSESNTLREMARKREEYFNAGVRLVWFLEPNARTMEVFTSADQSVVIAEDRTLDGGTLLPGFSLPLAELFARAGDRLAENS